MKKNFALLLAAVFCLSLTACGVSNETDAGGTDVETDAGGTDVEPDIGGTDVEPDIGGTDVDPDIGEIDVEPDIGEDDVCGSDWRTTGIWCTDGIITRDGEETDVLVCVHKADATFYYDTEDQTLFDFVDYPITLEGDAWEMFQSIDFADLNGDDNSDVTMRFDDGGNELLMVWFWDTESKLYVYQPEESLIGGDDDGRGNLVPDDGDAVPVLMGGALPFTNMEILKSENYEDGTYYYADVAEDGQIIVVNTVLPHNLVDDAQTLEDYLTDCALDLGKANTDLLQTVEQNDVYSEMMSYPVYIVTYTSGGEEDTREWTVFAMDTDCYTYLYGFGVTLDAAENMESVYHDIFAGLYLSDGE